MVNVMTRNMTIPIMKTLLQNAEKYFVGLESDRVFRFRDFYEFRKGEYYKKIPDDIEFLLNNRDDGKNEISGLYIFYEANKAVYIGISKTIIRRIKQHMRGKSHYESSLAYLIFKEKRGFKGPRLNDEYKKHRENIQSMMREEWTFKIIPEKRPHERYFLEIYLAIKLKTRWNDFDTH